VYGFGILYIGVRFDIKESVLAIAVVAIALGGSRFYTVRRPDERIARLFRAAAELFLLSFLCGALSYLAAALNRPLWDDVLDAWDIGLGFHWREWLEVLNAYPRVHILLAIAYHSMLPQLMLAIIALVTVKSYRALDTFLAAFGLAATVTVIVSGIMPAVSPLVHYGILPSDYPNITLAVPKEFADHVQALRDGSMRMIHLSGGQGLVTFPSFHTASGVLLALAFWQVPFVRWFGLVLNGLLLLSVPIEGSHYLVDVIAGAAVAFASWLLARLFTAAGADTRIIEVRKGGSCGLEARTRMISSGDSII